MSSAAVNVGSLVKMVYSSLVAGISVSLIFSIVILGAVRSIDTRRANRDGASAAYAALATLGVVLATALVIYGLVLIARKR